MSNAPTIRMEKVDPADAVDARGLPGQIACGMRIRPK
jgi:hypothetical protein